MDIQFDAAVLPGGWWTLLGLLALGLLLGKGDWRFRDIALPILAAFLGTLGPTFPSGAAWAVALLAATFTLGSRNPGRAAVAVPTVALSFAFGSALGGVTGAGLLAFLLGGVVLVALGLLVATVIELATLALPDFHY